MVQTSTVVIMMRLSFTTQTKVYLPTAAVVMNECSKMAMSLVLIVAESGGSPAAACRTLHQEIIVNWKGTLLTSVPALLYTLQTNLIYVGSQHLDGTTLQVTAQLKILTTAIFSVTLLGRVVSGVQWLSLFVLMVGVVVVHSKPADVMQKTSDAMSYTEQLENAATLEEIEGLLPALDDASGQSFPPIRPPPPCVCDQCVESMRACACVWGGSTGVRLSTDCRQFGRGCDRAKAMHVTSYPVRIKETTALRRPLPTDDMNRRHVLHARASRRWFGEQASPTCGSGWRASSARPSRPVSPGCTLKKSSSRAGQ